MQAERGCVAAVPGSTGIAVPGNLPLLVKAVVASFNARCDKCPRGTQSKHWSARRTVFRDVV